MRITDVLLGEHGVLYALFDELETCARSAKSTGELRVALRLLETTLLSHAVLEDELLFPALESESQAEGPVAVMRQEHAEIERDCRRLGTIANLQELAQLLRHTLMMARNHFAKEEQMLFPLANEVLGERTERLAAAWAQRRNLTL